MSDGSVPEAVFKALNRPRMEGESDSNFVTRISREIGLDDPAAMTLIAMMLHFTTSMAKIPGKIEKASNQVLTDTRGALEAEGAQIVRKTASDLARDLRASVGEAAVHEAQRMEALSLGLLVGFLCVFTSSVFTLGYILGVNRTHPVPPFIPAWWSGTTIFDTLLRAPVGWAGLWIIFVVSAANLCVRSWKARRTSAFSDEPTTVGLEHWILFAISLGMLIFFNSVS